MAIGIATASTASTPSSAATSSRQARNAAVPTASVVSTGPVTMAPAGSSRRSRRRVVPASCATCRPLSLHASAARTPAPPALVTIAIRLPAGSGWQASSAAASISSPKLAVDDDAGLAKQRFLGHQAGGRGGVRNREARRACRPAVDRPPMTVSTGIRCPTRRAVRANLRGLPKDST